ncbi:MAG: SGNH/GDSL hydrolase family protein [Candidatus Heimdallarchaeota archaeon]|nr:SGNH/GDSL hydrolase family protein [Candidatus Heimdallarchaeota archaeon]
MIGYVILGISGFLVLAVIYAYLRATRLPSNRPAKYVDDGRPVVAMIGDSITHGNIGFNFVNALQKKYPKYHFVNAGINAHMAYSVVQRLDEIIATKPAYAFLMIGTNDVNYTFGEKFAKNYKALKLPQEPTKAWYRENLNIIIDRLKAVDCIISIFSLPTIGETITEPEYLRATEYSETILEVARDQNIRYLPLHERMTEFLDERPVDPPFEHAKSDNFMVQAIAKHYLFGQSWQNIAEKLGFHLHIDNLHLSEKGALMVVDLVSSALEDA